MNLSFRYRGFSKKFSGNILILKVLVFQKIILIINKRKNTMNNLDPQYQNLLQYILKSGIKKEDRTGTGTISVFGRQIRHKMSEGFPLLK